MTYYHHWFEEFVKSKHICVHFFQMKVHFRIYLIVWIHLSYCIISVWGGAAKQRISSLFTAQKYCLRVLFGDRLAYLDKFKTCARTRPIGQQKLDHKFFIKEHTKPIFKHNNILALQNLYTYHCYLELYKIMKFRAPISLHEGYTCSSRKPCLLICQADPPDNHNTRSTKIFNIWGGGGGQPHFTSSQFCLFWLPE